MSSTRANGAANGIGVSGEALNGFPESKRFSDIPSTIDIPVADQDDEAVEIDLEELADDPTELCTLFEMENAARTYWMTVALAYAKQSKVDFAIEMLTRGATAMQASNPREKLSMITCLCWMYLLKSREAPRVMPEETFSPDMKTKETYLQLATQTLNEASKINPAFPPLFLARGALLVRKASLLSLSKFSGTSGAVDPEKVEVLRSAIKSFDDALRVSQGKNMLAVLGRARAHFSLGRYADALLGYQDVLRKMPDLVDPDPRIGIGCCFWQLGFKDDAKMAWERSLEVNPDTKIPNILLGIYYLDASGRHSVNSTEFLRLYKLAMTTYAQKSFKSDKEVPLTCATFANFFLSRKSYENVTTLANKAIHYTDVNAIASDGWYLLARKEHYNGDLDRAGDYYRRADDARGGVERGYLPAKFGLAQLSILKGDYGEAKLRLEKMIQQSKTHEAQILLGTIYAEEVFANQLAASKEDKTTEAKKAIALLEAVRAAWKDSKKNLAPDSAVLLNLARLYEIEKPDKALECLKQVEQMELKQLPDHARRAKTADDDGMLRELRPYLSPQLLNNMGCFHYQSEKLELASELFEAAADACKRISMSEEESDTDALLTTVMFNLGRSYEARGMTEKAMECYEGLLNRHADYTDAQTRLAYIKLRTHPNKEGPDAVSKLYNDNKNDVEVRALYGWFLGRISSRKNEDSELRHYKHTLQQFDKRDRYALVGMGNLLLMSAREMRRESEQDRQKRSAAYGRSVEFFEKALQLDPKNAYAAQGVAIALVEDRKDYKNALPIFTKVRDTVKEAHVYVNLGHIYSELRQFNKSIESYEIALSKEGKAKDVGILSCLGRTWLNKGRAERNLEAYKTALQYAQKALAVDPDQVHYKFNVAFVQIQLAMTIYAMGEQQRNSLQLEDAAQGLEAAIKALDEIATSNQTPYPKADIEQRASMARNTQRKQLERALASQREYDSRNKEKLAAALELRQAELRRREAEKQKAEEAERERQEKIRKEREAIAEHDRLLAEKRAEEERLRMEAEMTMDSETGEHVKRKKRPARRAQSGSQEPKKARPRRRKGDDDGNEESGGEERRPKKKMRLTNRKEAASAGKYKSAEMVVDSDDDDELARAERALERAGSPASATEDAEQKEASDKMDVDHPIDEDAGDEEEEEEGTVARRPKRSRRDRILDESDEEEATSSLAKGGGGNGSEAAQKTHMADPKDGKE